MGRYITINEKNAVTGVRYGYSIVEGEIESEAGELGQIMQEDGTFITPEPEQIDEIPTMEDKVNYLYYKAKGLI